MLGMVTQGEILGYSAGPAPAAPAGPDPPPGGGPGQPAHFQPAAFFQLRSWTPPRVLKKNPDQESMLSTNIYFLSENDPPTLCPVKFGAQPGAQFLAQFFSAIFRNF